MKKKYVNTQYQIKVSLNRTVHDRLKYARHLTGRTFSDIAKDAIFLWLESNEIKLPENFKEKSA